MKRIYEKMSLGLSLLITFLLITGCANEEALKPLDNQSIEERGLINNGGFVSKIFWGLSSQNTLTKYAVGPPLKVLNTVPLNGLGLGEFMMAIDFRPDGAQVGGGGGTLYGVSNLSMLYVIDATSGDVKAVSRGPFEPNINGNTVGLDFDPSTDQLRLVTDLDQNLRLDPSQGIVIAVDSSLNPALNDVNGIAYMPSRGAVTLYAIDVVSATLLRQEPQNDGTLVRIGPLGLVISGEGGFDSKVNGKSGLAALFGHVIGGGITLGDNLNLDATRIYEINLQTGKATYRGKLDRDIIGIAIL